MQPNISMIIQSIWSNSDSAIWKMLIIFIIIILSFIKYFKTVATTSLHHIDRWWFRLFYQPPFHLGDFSKCESGYGERQSTVRNRELMKKNFWRKWKNSPKCVEGWLIRWCLYRSHAVVAAFFEVFYTR